MKATKNPGPSTLANVPASAVQRLRTRQDLVRTALQRAQSLRRDERILVTTLLGAGVSASDLACVARCPPRDIQRRFKRVLRRLDSESFIFAMRNAEHWPALRRNIAHAVLMQGTTQRDAAHRLGVSIHTVRKELGHIAALREFHATSVNPVLAQTLHPPHCDEDREPEHAAEAMNHATERDDEE